MLHLEFTYYGANDWLLDRAHELPAQSIEVVLCWKSTGQPHVYHSPLGSRTTAINLLVAITYRYSRSGALNKVITMATSV